MGIQQEIQNIINKHNSLNLISKLKNIGRPKIHTSKFTAFATIKDVSKFSKLPKDVKSDLDMKIPMDVELWILCEGENRDGIVTSLEMTNSLEKWGEGLDIIPLHDDSEDITDYNIDQECGSTDSSRIGKKDGKNWIVADARITSRNIAYQMYLRQLKGEPIEISAEYKWQKYIDENGDIIQTNIRPGAISLVKGGHIVGNELRIKSPI